MAKRHSVRLVLIYQLTISAMNARSASGTKAFFEAHRLILFLLLATLIVITIEIVAFDASTYFSTFLNLAAMEKWSMRSIGTARKTQREFFQRSQLYTKFFPV